MKEDVKFSLDKLYEIAKATGAHVFTDFIILEDCIRQTRINIFVDDVEVAKKVRELLGFTRMRKEYYIGDELWRESNIQIWTGRECKIVGYKEVCEPAKVTKVPIYDCKLSNNEDKE